MFIKSYLSKLVEKITGRKCTRCRHNCDGRCYNPNGRMFMRCWHSITRPGFEKRPPRYLKTTPALTPEEEHQLQKIRTALEEAGATARESSLLED